MTKIHEDRKDIDIFQKDLRDKVRTELSISRSFLPSLSLTVVSNHSPFVFWNLRYAFDRDAWHKAQWLLPKLYDKLLSHEDTQGTALLQHSAIWIAIVNYALWKGYFSWIDSLAQVVLKKGLALSKKRQVLLRIATLHYLRSMKLRKARCCYEALSNLSHVNKDLYFELCIYTLDKELGLGFISDLKAYPIQDVRRFLVSKKLPGSKAKSLGAKAAILLRELCLSDKRLWQGLESKDASKQDLERYVVSHSLLQSLGAIYRRPPKGMDPCVNKKLSLPPDTVIEHYLLLSSLGFLFRAQRLLLKYMRHFGATQTFFAPIKECYLQNQKYYLYLLRQKKSSLALDLRGAYEIDYCLFRLHLMKQREFFWSNLDPRRWRSSTDANLPPARSDVHYLSLLQELSNPQAQFPNALSVALGFCDEHVREESPAKKDRPVHLYADIMLRNYLEAYLAKPLLFRRRYIYFKALILDALQGANDGRLDSTQIAFLLPSLFWTCYQYREQIFSPNKHASRSFLSYTQALTGSNFAARNLLVLYYTHSIPQELKLPKSHTEKKWLGSNGIMQHGGDSEGRQRIRNLVCNLLDRTPNSNPVLQTVLINVCIQSKELERALRISKRLILLYPYNSKLRFNHALVLQRLGQRAEAHQYYQAFQKSSLATLG